MQSSQVDLEAEVDRLRSELRSTREALIDMASEEFKDLFHGLYRCKSRKEAFDWLRSSVEEAVKRVNPRPAQEMGDLSHNGPRAYCPMCGASSGTPAGEYPHPGTLAQRKKPRRSVFLTTNQCFRVKSLMNYTRTI